MREYVRPTTPYETRIGWIIRRVICVVSLAMAIALSVQGRFWEAGIFAVWALLYLQVNYRRIRSARETLPTKRKMGQRFDWTPRWNDATGTGEAVVMPAADFRRVRKTLGMLGQIADDDFPEPGEATKIRDLARELMKNDRP
jgi:hypothetical protein